MGTTQTFSAMLNEYLPNQLLKEEMIKRTWLINNVERDDNWKGGTLIVPFKAAGASSVAYGSLTADTDIAEDKYVRGQVSGYKEIWGSMIFNQRDLMEHDKISEQNFLKILPDSVDDFMSHMKNMISVNLLVGAHFATLTADGDASGNITVDRPDRFEIGMKLTVDDDDSAASAACYVNTININTGVINLVTARGGVTPIDLSAYTVAQNAKCYQDGAQANAFSSLRGALLSAANGGDTTLYGQTKTAYPYLQAINVSGTDVTAANIMEKIFDALTTIQRLGKGAPTKVAMSYKNLGSCMKVVEGSKGSFTANQAKTSQYGYTEIEVGSVKGALTLVGIQEADDDVIFFLDMRGMKFHSNGFIRKNKSPDGLEYFVKRATTGYQYIIDICLFGEFVVTRPSYQGVLYGISYT